MFHAIKTFLIIIFCDLKWRYLTCNGTRSGFTLLEILVVISLITVIAGFSIIFGIDAYHGHIYHAEKGIAMDLLKKARGQAISNMHQISHGIRFENTEYILFRGNVYVAGDPTNESIPKNAAITISGPQEIVFSQLSGDASPAGTLTVSDGVRSQTISINSEGRIN